MLEVQDTRNLQYFIHITASLPQDVHLSGDLLLSVRVLAVYIASECVCVCVVCVCVWAYVCVHISVSWLRNVQCIASL